MKPHKSGKIILLIFVLLSFSNSFSQLPYNLIDGKDHKYCKSCRELIDSMPPEVLFGIHIRENGDVYFSMSDKQWFHKIFKNNSYGITVDIVSKDRYLCNKSIDKNAGLPKGTMLEPVYKPALISGMSELTQGYVLTKIGQVPAALKNKELEGNLVILNGNYICYYTNFVDLDRNVWQLLPMGLFTDSLLNDQKINDSSRKDYFTYSKKIQIEVPFSKGSTAFSNSYLQHFYDSLNISSYKIQKVEIRAYSSVEGSEKKNKDLVNGRADAMIRALKKHQPSLSRIKILAAENWLDFFKDIKETKFSGLSEFSKAIIKQKLSDLPVAAEAEPILAKERKVVTTIYLEARSTATSLNDSSILSDFKSAVDAKDVTKARMIQKELVDRIFDKKMPLEYLGKLEVPQTKEFSAFLNDREVYKYLLSATTEFEALDHFLMLKKLDSSNGRINYNICALRFFMWQYGNDTSSSKILLKEINRLPAEGINVTLVKRMLINYYILKCEDQMHVFDYAGKDSSLSFIRRLYNEVKLNDEDIYSIAKYYSFYAHRDWAEAIIEPRIDKLDASEDLVFYYVNLLLFQPGKYEEEGFIKATLNAINLNRERFCRFFLPIGTGGASMQLLDYERIKKLYCEECR